MLLIFCQGYQENEIILVPRLLSKLKLDQDFPGGAWRLEFSYHMDAVGLAPADTKIQGCLVPLYQMAWSFMFQPPRLTKVEQCKPCAQTCSTALFRDAEQRSCAFGTDADFFMFLIPD